jgi:hypothetical protein
LTTDGVLYKLLIMRILRCFISFIRNYNWVDEPKWENDDEKAWTAFLATPTGKKLSLILLNLTLRQNASAVQKSNERLASACGYSIGFRGCVAVLESLSTSKLNSAVPGYGDGEDEPVAN